MSRGLNPTASPEDVLQMNALQYAESVKPYRLFSSFLGPALTPDLAPGPGPVAAATIPALVAVAMNGTWMCCMLQAFFFVNNCPLLFIDCENGRTVQVDVSFPNPSPVVF